MSKIKSLSQLKKDANTGKLRAEMVYRFGEEIPERLRGIRPVLRANSVALIFQNNDGKESELRIERAALCEYDGDSLKLFGYGERDLTAEEESVLSAVNAEMKRWYEQYPYCNGYWHKLDFLRKRGMEYLMGGSFVGSKRYNYNGKIIDKNIRGKLEIEYRFV